MLDSVKSYMKEITPGHYDVRLKKDQRGHYLTIGGKHSYELETLDRIKLSKPSVAKYLSSKEKFKVRVVAKNASSNPERVAVLSGINSILNGQNPEPIEDLYHKFYKEITMSDIPNIRHEDIGGLDEVISDLRWSLETPLINRETCEYLGVRPPTGVLFVGPPGVGKSLTGSLIANNTQCNFVPMSVADIASSLHTEMETNIADYFESADHISNITKRPSIIFVDEAERLLYSRADTNQWDKLVTNEMLRTLSSIKGNKNIIFMGATNVPWEIDKAFYREGRIERVVYFPYPDDKGRSKILDVYLKKLPKKEIDVPKLAKDTKGFSGADIKSLCKQASNFAMRRIGKTPEGFQNIKYQDLATSSNGLIMEDFQKAMKSLKVNPRVADSWTRSFSIWNKSLSNEDTGTMYQ
jgi:SpoVK/Ycf46/Vps4 family AAA+-type ATPase